MLKNPIVWIDCEMTGLDLSIDELVEVSVVITDPELNPIDEGIDLLVRPSPEAVAHMDDFVRNMHTNSGLINEWDEGLSLDEAETRVLDYIKKFVPEVRRAPLGGNSVATDKTFLEKYMPNVIDHLHYRIIDVSSIKELAKRWYPRAYFNSPAKTGNHRALGDIYDSIDELRYYRGILMPRGDGPTTRECEAAAKEATGKTVKLAQRRESENSPTAD